MINRLMPGIRSTSLLALFTTMLMVVATLPARAVDIQEVVSPGGIKALLVEDYTVPVVALQFSFKGGATQDMPGREGTSELLSTLLDEGAGDLEARALQEKLDEVGVEYRFDSGQDGFSGGIRMLRENFSEGAALLGTMLSKPRFDDDPVNRMKTTLLTRLQQRVNDPQQIAGRAMREALYADHPYARSANGTVESVPSITVDDLKAYHRNVFARDNVVIGVVGAISAEELKPILDEVFAGLPDKANLTPVSEITATTGQTIHVDLDVPQTVISFALPAIKRDDPDFFAAYIVNQVLGGGAFTSRLYEEVREKRGLAYGAYSYIATNDYSGTFFASSATGADRAAETVAIMRAEIERMGKEGPSAEELDKAKKYIAGSYAISNLDSSTKIASVLVGIQQENLGLDYIDRRQDLIAAVTLDKAKEVAARLFSGEPTQVTVGSKLTN